MLRGQTISTLFPDTTLFRSTWTSTDACGNVSAPVSQTITVVDVTAPTLSGQGGNATINCPATPQFTSATATDESDSPPSLDFSHNLLPTARAGAYSVLRN